MANEEVVPTKASPTPVAMISLNEFCVDLSRRQPAEMVGAFHYTQRAANVTHNTQAAYQASFEKFATTPD